MPKIYETNFKISFFTVYLQWVSPFLTLLLWFTHISVCFISPKLLYLNIIALTGYLSVFSTPFLSLCFANNFILFYFACRRVKIFALNLNKVYFDAPDVCRLSSLTMSPLNPLAPSIFYTTHSALCLCIRLIKLCVCVCMRVQSPILNGAFTHILKYL